MTTSKDRSVAQEKRVARDLGGHVTTASGAKPFNKCDVHSTVFVTECKTTEKASYSLKQAEWKKVQNEAYKKGKTPVMVVDIQDCRLAVIPYHLLPMLQKMMEDAENE